MRRENAVVVRHISAALAVQNLMHKLKYSEPLPFTRQEALDILAGKNITKICDVLIGITFHDPDRKWIESILIQNSNHENEEIRALVATCIGHIARIHKDLTINKIRPILQILLTDKGKNVRGSAEDAIEDINIFIPKYKNKIGI